MVVKDNSSLKSKQQKVRQILRARNTPAQLNII